MCIASCFYEDTDGKATTIEATINISTSTSVSTSVSVSV
jgi:hypothetical protein